MTKIFLTGFILLALVQFETNANPFSCKISEPSTTMIAPKTLKLVYKGYLVSENRTFGIVQIEGKGYEVSEGDIILGFKILKISKLSLQYQYRKSIYNSDL